MMNVVDEDENATANQTLGVLLDRILPPDAISPGGAESGAYSYVTAGTRPGGHLAEFAPVHRNLLDALDRAGFTALAAPDQDALLRAIDAGAAPLGIGDPAALRAAFRALVEQAQEGYYTDPQIWASIGFKVTG